MLNFFKNLFAGTESSKTFRELNRLSDKELADMGISRCDIYNIARSVKQKSRNDDLEFEVHP